MAAGVAFYWQETVCCCAIDFIGAVVKICSKSDDDGLFLKVEEEVGKEA